MRYPPAPALLLAAPVLVALVLALAACGGIGGTAPPAGGDAASAPSSPSSAPTSFSAAPLPPSPSPEGARVTDSALVVTVVDSPGATPRRWTLTCDPPGGDHPRAADACAAIDAAARPFAPKPADMMCTQIYGGPQTATISGTWRGERVDASYRRTDGCEIARWNALAAVLGSGGTGS